jgi:hypothetical protein
MYEDRERDTISYQNVSKLYKMVSYRRISLTKLFPVYHFFSVVPMSNYKGLSEYVKAKDLL